MVAPSHEVIMLTLFWFKSHSSPALLQQCYSQPIILLRVVWCDYDVTFVMTLLMRSLFLLHFCSEAILTYHA